MNIILKALLANAKKAKGGNSAPPVPFMKIKAEKQDRPLPGELLEENDIPYADPAKGLFADVVFPKKKETKTLPIVIFVHGGALVTGDRKADRVFCQELALKGFVVYSVEYRLIDRADAYGMVSDIFDAFEMVRNTAGRFRGDPDRVSLCGESAGAFICIYAAAGESKTLRKIFGIKKEPLHISHLILFSGMIYTMGIDLIGTVYRRALFGKKNLGLGSMKKLSPDNPKLLRYLPPVYLVSSDADFMSGNTLDFAKALRRWHHDYKLMYYPIGEELTHAFPALLPSLPESTEVIDAVSEWITGA